MSTNSILLVTDISEQAGDVIQFTELELQQINRRTTNDCKVLIFNLINTTHVYLVCIVVHPVGAKVATF